MCIRDRVKSLEQELAEQKFRLFNIVDNNSKVTFYTGFPSYGALQAFYKYLGPAVDNLRYSSCEKTNETGKSITVLVVLPHN